MAQEVVGHAAGSGDVPAVAGVQIAQHEAVHGPGLSARPAAAGRAALSGGRILDGTGFGVVAHDVVHGAVGLEEVLNHVIGVGLRHQREARIVRVGAHRVQKGQVHHRVDDRPAGARAVVIVVPRADKAVARIPAPRLSVLRTGS